MSNSPGKIFFILGPSGVGKGVTIELLRKRHPEFFFPISVTTRPMREKESQGYPYHFVSNKEFERDIENGIFLEHAKVHELYYYGTRKDEIMDAIKHGKTVVKELDIQGYRQARDHFHNGELISIFLLPPSKETLIKRITGRASISKEEITHRMVSLENELAGAHECNIQLQFEESDTIESQYTKVEAAILSSI